jgi:aquaporin NIP
MRRIFVAEVFGTYCLVFAGTGAIVVDRQTGGIIGHAGIAMTFGLIICAMIYALGQVSGCHLNPAVSLGFCLAGRMNFARLPMYMVAQLFGAVLASGTLYALFPSADSLGNTHPAGDVGQAFLLELILTLILMVVVLAVSDESNESRALAGVAVGALIALEALFAGPITGASMNPARSIAPALMTGEHMHLWLYVTAPTIGAAAGVLIHRFLYAPVNGGLVVIGAEREQA